MKNILLFLLLGINICNAQSVYIYGKITDTEYNNPIQNVSVSFKNKQSVSDKYGNYTIIIPKEKGSLSFRLIGYEKLQKTIEPSNDTIRINIKLKPEPYLLTPVAVSSPKKADTVFGTWKFSIEDYEFYNDKFILLTFEKSLKNAKITVIDENQKILSACKIPYEAFQLKKDYLGFVNVYCENHIYRIIIDENGLVKLGELPAEEYTRRIVPCIDTIEEKIYFSNYDRDYPEFSYFAFNTTDTSYSPIRKVYDKEALQSYNMEYYFLNPRDRLTAKQIADEYNVDFHRVAAIMSGVTKSLFYTPLYAPLFIIKDTVCIFDHYSNAIFKYNKENHLLDSISISYHHPKSWKEWKHLLIADEVTRDVYAVYQKNGYYHLKKINIHNGKIEFSYKLSNPYAEHLKIKNGSVYYVYRPFESLQERFVYKELITKN